MVNVSTTYARLGIILSLISCSIEHPRVSAGRWLCMRVLADRLMLGIVANRVLPHEHSHPIPYDLFCTRKIPIVGSSRLVKLTPAPQVRPIPHRALVQGRLRSLSCRMGVCRETERVCHREKGKRVRATWLQPKRSTTSGTPSLSVVRCGIEHLPRFGLRRVVALTTPLGHSKRQSHRFPPCPWTPTA